MEPESRTHPNARWKRLRAVGLVLLLSWLVAMMIPSCTRRFLLWDGPFRGQVVDRETGQPIEGAAVVAVWNGVHGYGLVHDSEYFIEAKETVTDADGRFEIPLYVRLSIDPLSIFEEPLFTIFRPGYTFCADHTADAQGDCGLPIIKLKRTTGQERGDDTGTPNLSDDVPRNKAPELLRLIDEDRSHKGLN